MPRCHQDKLHAITSECPPRDSQVRELAYRVSDGSDVQLLWHPDDDLVWLSAGDQQTAVRFELPVPGNRAMFAADNPLAR